MSDCCVHAILADRWPSEIVMKPSPYSTSGGHVPWIESYLIRYAIDSGAAMSFKCTISNVSGMCQAILSTSRPAQRTHTGEPACAHACATPLLTPILVKQCSQGAPLGTRARTRRISAQSCQIRVSAHKARTNSAQAIESNLCWHECLRAGAGAGGNLSCLPPRRLLMAAEDSLRSDEMLKRRAGTAQTAAAANACAGVVRGKRILPNLLAGGSHEAANTGLVL